MNFGRHAGIALLCAALAGCATPGGSHNSGNDDPLEPMNRAVFDSNEAFDAAFVKPIAEGYLAIVPPFVRDRIRAFIDNLQEPRIFVNNLLQGRVNDAGYTFARFYMNTTVGLAGLFDWASEHGLPRQTGDFGQTLAVWGVDAGPYLVLPFLGPSNVRDVFGFAVDFYITPPAHFVPGATGWWITGGTYAVAGIDLRARNIETLDQIKAHALDYYAQFRSLARQHREGQVRAAKGLPESPDDLVDPGAPPD